MAEGIKPGGSFGIEVKVGDEVVGHRGTMIAGSAPGMKLAEWKEAR